MKCKFIMLYLFSFLGSNKIQQHNRYGFVLLCFLFPFISQFVFICNFTCGGILIFEVLSCPVSSFLQVLSPHRSPPQAHPPLLALQGGDRPSPPQSTRSANPLHLMTKRKWYVVFDLIYRSLVVLRHTFRG